MRLKSAIWLVIGFALSVAPITLLLDRQSTAVVREADWIDRVSAAVAGRRVLEARLSRGFSRHVSERAARAATGSSDLIQVETILATLETEARDTADPMLLHALGIGQLVLGRAEEAVTSLEFAAGSLDQADTLNDMAAAYLLLAETKTTPLLEVAKAIDATNRALAINPELVPALYNRALALQMAGAKRQATLAWQAYLALETDDAWKADANVRLTKSAQPILLCAGVNLVVRDCVDEAREVTERLIGAWSSSPGAHAEKWPQINHLAAELATVTGDALLVRAVGALSQSSEPCQKTLRVGHQHFKGGRDLYDADRRHEAFAEFEAAARELKRCQSPFWLWAELYAAIIDVHTRRLRQAVVRLDQIESVAASESYRAVLGRAQWLRGIVQLHFSGPAIALHSYHAALRSYRDMNDAVGIANVANSAADSHRIIGELREGWDLLAEALRLESRMTDASRRYLIYYNTTLFALASGLPRAALVFQQEAIAEARARKGHGGLIESLTMVSTVYAALGDASGALAALDEAAALQQQLRDPQQAAYMLARRAAVEGQLQVERASTDALVNLTAAIDHFRVFESAEVPRLLQFRARAARAAGFSDDARADLRAALDGFERRRLSLSSAQRLSYADEGWTIYQDLIQLHLESENWSNALILAETARARSIRGVPTDRAMLDAWSQLEPGTALLFYLVSRTGSHVWTISAAGVQHNTLATDVDELRSEVQALRWRIEHSTGSEDVDASLARLYRSLIEPAQVSDDIQTIVVVADSFLSRVPFHALRTPRGRFLIEERQVAVAPSVTLYSARQSSVPHDPSSKRVVVVGDPAFDSRAFGLRRLPGARLEAAQVASVHPTSTLIIGDDATKARLQAAFLDADVIHFAGHALANTEYPSLSRLLTAANPLAQDDLALSAAEIGTLGLRRRSLVVLSACQTGEGRIGSAEGPLSIGRAFLEAGAGAVVVSSWDIEDRVTPRLFEEFHRQYRQDSDAVRALRVGQVEMIRSGAPLRDWAAFHIVVGGNPRNSN